MGHRTDDLLIAALLTLMFATGLPQFVPGVPTLERWVDPIADGTGLQQGTWQLFAPDPDRVNSWVEARVRWSTGETTTVSTPDWQRWSLWEKLEGGRYPKFVENLQRPGATTLRDEWAAWAAWQAPPPSPTADVVEVELVRHFWVVPPAGTLRPDGHRPPTPPRDRFPGRARLSVWRPE